ncbi:sialidase family protein [Fodinicola acaciae]|uniref:sialidase family protein n=1 Tax=Fodinicola acaciae TaxID=2681555 RepID=UPI0013D8081A|nr:sialidase family protein [Fodinicola acaciae]
MSDVDVFGEKVADIRGQVVDRPMSSFAQLQAKARRRRTTRRVGGVAAVAAVALAVAAVPLTLHQVGGKVASDQPVKGAIVATPVEMSQIKKVVDTAPLDTRTAYAIVQTKAGSYGLARTLDGHDWKAWVLPAAMQAAAAADFTGQHHSRVNPTGVRPGSGPAVVSRLVVKYRDSLSRDGGQTWSPITDGRRVVVDGLRDDGQPVTDWLGDPVSSVAQGWPVSTFVQHGAGQSRTEFLATLDPTTGVWHRLTASPTTRPTDSLDGIQRDPTGVLWATYRTVKDRMAGHMVLAVSHDGGRTWSRTPLTAAGRFVTSVPQSVDGRHAVVPVQYGPQPEVDQKWMQAGVMLTDDGGRTWRFQQTHGQTTPGNTAKGPALSDDALLLQDGSFISTSHGKQPAVVRSTDYGDSGQPVAGTDGAALLMRTLTGGYLLTVDPGGVLRGQNRISDDGLHWQPAPAPPAGQ